MKTWFVYIVQCQDRTFYTGCTDDVTRRVATHNLGKGAKYTRSRLPVKVIFFEECTSHSHALKRESAIKSLSRAQKIKLINSDG